MIYQVFKKLVIAIVLFGAGSLSGIWFTWNRQPVSVQPRPCRERVALYGEVRSCPAGMHLEVAGNDSIAYIICRCTGSEDEPSPTLKDEEPLRSVPLPAHTGISL